MKKPVLITYQQVKQLRTLASKVLLDNETYRYWLRSNFEVESCKLLTISEAETAIQMLQNMNNETLADFLITPKQVRYIKSLWIDIDVANCENGDKHLRGFLKNRFGVDRLEDLSRKQAHGAIAAVLRMKQRQATCSVAVKEDTISVQTKENEYVFNLPNNKKYNA